MFYDLDHHITCVDGVHNEDTTSFQLIFKRSLWWDMPLETSYMCMYFKVEGLCRLLGCKLSHNIHCLLWLCMCTRVCYDWSWMLIWCGCFSACGLHTLYPPLVYTNNIHSVTSLAMYVYMRYVVTDHADNNYVGDVMWVCTCTCLYIPPPPQMRISPYCVLWVLWLVM